MRNLEQTGYRTNFTLLANFYKKLNAKYNTRSPENAFTLARRVMSTAPTKTARARYYSLYWKTVLPHERKVLAHFRDHGVWHARNYYKHNSDRATPRPNPKPKPKPKSPTNVRRDLVLAQFKPFWNGTTSNNHKIIRNYIAAHKSPSPVKATSANRAVWNKYKSALDNINALKTAKARAEWLKAKKLNFKKDELVTLRNYVKGKNQANRNRRAEKKA